MKVWFCNGIRRGFGAASLRLPAMVLAWTLMLTLPALSVAQTPAASDLPPPSASPGAALPLMPPPRLPSPSDAARPPSTPAPARDAETPSTPAPAREPIPIVLVLPLDSPTFGRAADAVKAGFVTAADAANAKYLVIGHSDGDVRAAFDKAREAGARVIIGPLLRDDVKVIASAADGLPPTIALNQLDEAAALPVNIYTMTLGIDSEGVQLARRAREDGAQSVVVIGTDAPLQKRFASAFAGEWVLQGGAPPVTFRLDRAPDMLALLKREFLRAKADAVVLALDAPDALLVKPYLGQVTAYASSQVYERRPREALRDLDGVRFVEIPWLADPSSPAFSGIRRRDYPSASLDRLYALGIDAARVAVAFSDGAPQSLEFDGATGHVRLDSSRQFVRDATVLQFQDGEIVRAASR